MVPSLLWRLTPTGEPTFFSKRLIEFCGSDVTAFAQSGENRLASAMKTLFHPDDIPRLEDSMLIIASDARAHEHASDGLTVPGAKNAKVAQVYEHAIPGMPGKSIKGVTVDYGPGGFSPSHTHAKSAIIDATVVEGSVRMQVNDGPEVSYTVGQNWTEMPGDHHRVSANARDTKPAKILAVFVVDDKDTQLTIPDAR